MKHFMTTHIRLHERAGTLEVDRLTFKTCLDVVRSKHETTIENVVIPDMPNSFVHCIKGMKQPFAVAVYPTSKPTQYYILLDKISNDLLEKIKKMESADEDFQNKLSSYVRPARRGQAILGSLLRKGGSPSDAGRNVRAAKPGKQLGGRRSFRLGQGRYGDIRKAPREG